MMRRKAAAGLVALAMSGATVDALLKNAYFAFGMLLLMTLTSFYLLSKK